MAVNWTWTVVTLKKRTKSYVEKRVPFCGVYESEHTERDTYGNKVQKVTLRDVTSQDNTLRLEHCTFLKSKYFESLSPGATVNFVARVTYTTNRYLGSLSNVPKSKFSLKLVRPTKVKS